MAAILAGIDPGDEVIMPSFTFVSTANAVVLRGGVPVFVDIRPDTLNLDETKVEAAITARTKAIVAGPLRRRGCAMDALCEIAARRSLLVVEDAAQGAHVHVPGPRRSAALATSLRLSFHETKNVTCGEGGALLVNGADWVERAEIVHEKGTNRQRFFRGQVDKYSWVDIGSSYPMSELQAAFLWSQLEAATMLTEARLGIWRRYDEAFAPLEQRERLRRPIVPEECTHNGHMYYILLAPEVSRGSFIDGLAAANINAVFHYVPLHSSLAGGKHGRAIGDLTVTDDVSDRLVRLPLWPGLSDAEIARVIAGVTQLLDA